MEQEIDENFIYIEDLDEEIKEVGDEDVKNIEEPQERNDAICIFSKHTGSVFCGALSKGEILAATGGEDDKAYVWDTVSSDILFECTGHKDSVIFSDFNHDDSFLATADMSGIIQIWKMSNKSVVWNYDMGDISWMQWHPAANVLLGGSVQGEVYMWKIPDNDCKILPGTGNRVEAGAILPDGRRLVVGYGDGTIRIVDLRTTLVLFTIAQNVGHARDVTSVDCYVDNNLIISAAIDGKTIISSSQNGKVLAVLQDLGGMRNENDTKKLDKMEEDKGNWIECVAFYKGSEHQIAAAGSSNGEIFIWDIAKQIIRHTIGQESGISKLTWKEGTAILFVAGLDGILRCYDGRSGTCLRVFISHIEDILDLCVSRNGKKILTTSDDSTARVFEIDTH